MSAGQSEPVGTNGLTEAETSQTASVMGLVGGPAQFNGAQDPLYDQAVAIVREYKRGSISMVQRILRIGYTRAACMVEAMELAGIITPWGPGGSGRDYVPEADRQAPQPAFERKKADDTEGGAL